MHATSEDLLQRFLSLHPKLIDLSLERIERLLGALGHPERKLAPVLHVAGTNGKGSTAAFLRALLEAQGKRVQVYSSPHLVHFHERIRLVSGPISEPDLLDILRDCEAANAGVPITFFEITTVAGLLAFSREEADFCILEVGLGGRYDATNVIDKPHACVITPVAKDHEGFLGHQLRGIAGEKAGIIKPDVPAFSAKQTPAAAEVIAEEAAAQGARLYRAGKDWTVRRRKDGFSYRDRYGALSLPYPALFGDHQIDNAALALAALRLSGTNLAEPAISKGLTQVTWPARLQRLKTGPLVAAAKGRPVWLDGGHNPHAARALARHFEGARLHLVLGIMANKKLETFLKLLAPAISSLAAVPILGQEAYSPGDIVRAAQSLGIAATSCANVESAVEAVRGDVDAIVVAGSLYLAGQVLAETSQDGARI